MSLEKEDLQKAIENFSESEETPAQRKGVQRANTEEKTYKVKNNGPNNPQKGSGKWYKNRKFKRGAPAVLLTCVFIAAVVVVNMIAGVLQDKFPALKADLTDSGAYQLTDETIDFLQTLEKKGDKITIRVLAPKGEYEASATHYLQASNLLQMYPVYNENIELEWVDLAANPNFASEYPHDTIYAGCYIVEAGDKHRIVTDSEILDIGTDATTGENYIKAVTLEPAVTTAILNVTSKSQEKVAFLEGFGGQDAATKKAGLKTLLERNNYEVSEISLLTEEIDESINMLVLFSPVADIDEDSSKKISDYLKNGGEYGKNLLVVAPASTAGETPILKSLLEEWSMKLEDGIVLEQDSTKQLSTQSPFYYIEEYIDQAYTQGLKDASLTFVDAYVRPITITDTTAAAGVLASSSQSVLYPFENTENFDLENAQEQQFYGAAVAKKGNEEKSSIALFGSEAALSQSYLEASSYNNGAYVINMINILTQRGDDTFTIEGKSAVKTQLGISAMQIQVLSIVFVVVLPLAILVIGLVVWLRRRNK